MYYNEFQKNIEKGKIKPVYLFYGEERFLIEEAISRLLEQTVNPDLRGFNYHIFDGKDIDLPDVLDIAQSPPFCSFLSADRQGWRLILIRDINLIPAEGLNLLIPYVKKPPSTTCLVLISHKLDMRKRFFLDIQDLVVPVQMQSLSTNQIFSWVKSKAKGFGITISEDAISFIIERRGKDLYGLLNEIEKLSIYLDEKKEVRLEDVKALIYGEETPSIFELTGCIGERKTKESLMLLSHCLTSGEPPLVILQMIARQFRIIWRIIETREIGGSPSDLLREIGIPRGFQGKIIKQSERFTTRELINAFSLLLKTDLELKSSRTPPRIVLETLILKLCSPL